MALTRGDKLIIIGAVALAGAVVLGLAVLKRPELFTGAPKAKPVAVEAQRAAMPTPPPAPAAATAIPPAPSSKPAPGPGPAQATPPTAVAPQAPGASQTPGASQMPGVPATSTAPTASGGAVKPPQAGEESLEKMFAEIAKDSHGPDKAGARPAAPQDQAPQPAPAPAPVEEVEPKPAPAPGATAVPVGPETPAKATAPNGAKSAKTKADAKAKPVEPAKTAKAAEPAAPKAQPEAKAKTKAEAKPQAAAGHVIRLVAEDKVGEFVLTVQTDKAPAQFEKMFIADPPRMVLDLPGSWSYTGPGARETGNGLIRRIRVGTHPDRFRVVLDMAPDALSRLRGTPTAERVPGGVTLKIPK